MSTARARSRRIDPPHDQGRVLTAADLAAVPAIPAGPFPSTPDEVRRARQRRPTQADARGWRTIRATCGDALQWAWTLPGLTTSQAIANALEDSADLVVTSPEDDYAFWEDYTLLAVVRHRIGQKPIVIVFRE